MHFSAYFGYSFIIIDVDYLFLFLLAQSHHVNKVEDTEDSKNTNLTYLKDISDIFQANKI